MSGKRTSVGTLPCGRAFAVSGIVGDGDLLHLVAEGLVLTDQHTALDAPGPRRVRGTER
jgi:hypothetical protein